MQLLELGNIKVEVIKKDIKNVHLSVYPPTGRVRISAPIRLDIETIRTFAITKLDWIKKQQAKYENQSRETPREYLNRESHYYNGKRYLLKIIELRESPKVVLKHSEIELQIRPNTPTDKRKTVLNNWYRKEMKKIIPKLIIKWESKMNIVVNEYGIKMMRTKWGSCNGTAKRIWLNLELAKKPPKCLEYVLVHEMIHLLERNHNDRFLSLLDEFMPNWRFYKDELSRLPISHADWKY